MPRQTELAHDAVRAVLRPGETAVDATAGNGHDTEFLARLVGPAGRVFAFDVQPAALDRTAARLRAAGLGNVTLFCRDHAELAAAVPAGCAGRVGAAMFNLGYLPGGDKSVITRPDSTRAALSAALGLLRPGGVLTVVAYPGHPGGADDLAAVRRFVGSLPDGTDIREISPGRATGPALFVVKTGAGPGASSESLAASRRRGSADRPGEQRDDEQDQEHEEQDPRDVGRAGGDPAEAEHRRDQRDDQEE